MTELAPIEYRSSRSEDVPAITEVLEPYVQAKLLLRRTEEELELLVTNGFVAVSEQQIIGFAAVEIYSRKLAEVQCLAVAQGYQRRGVGRALLERCIQLARDKRVLELMAITASEDFLRDCGFDYSLPNQKRALFVRTAEEDDG